MEERKGEDANAFLAARHGWLDILRREIKTRPKLVNDLEPGKTKDGGLGLLHLGVLGGHTSIVQYLLSLSQDINVDLRARGGLFPAGSTPLHLACQLGHLRIIRLLLNANADIYAKQEGSGYTPLHLAAQHGRVQVLRYIDARKRIQWTMKTTKGETLLHVAAEKGQIYVLRYLISQSGVESLRARNASGDLPIHCAVRGRHLNVCQMLIQMDLGMLCELDSFKRTPVELSSELSKSTERTSLREKYSELGKALQSYVGKTKKDVPTPWNTPPRQRIFLFSLPIVISCICIFVLYFLPYPLLGFVSSYLVMFLGYQLTQDWPKDAPSSLFVGLYVAIASSTAGCLWLDLGEQVPLTKAVLFGLSFVVTNCLYAHCIFRDPGIVTEERSRAFVSEIKGPMNLVDLIEMDYPPRLHCYTCDLLKPPGTKHCSTCDACVEGLDHHCIWLNNCVGKNNQPHFVAMLISLLTSQFLFLELLVNAHLALAGSPMAMLSTLWDVHRVSLAMLVIHIVFVAWVCSVLFQQMKSFTKEKPLHEWTRAKTE